MATIYYNIELVEHLLNRQSGRRLTQGELGLDFPSLIRMLHEESSRIGVYNPLRYPKAIAVPDDEHDLSILTDRRRYNIPYAVPTSLLVELTAAYSEVQA